MTYGRNLGWQSKRKFLPSLETRRSPIFSPYNIRVEEAEALQLLKTRHVQFLSLFSLQILLNSF